MKPRNGLAKDRMVPSLFDFLGFYGLRVFRKQLNFSKAQWNKIRKEELTCGSYLDKLVEVCNSDDPSYPNQSWKIPAISMAYASSKPSKRPLPCMSKRQPYQICTYKIKKLNATRQ